MVDTMLASDLISAAAAGYTVVLASCDLDLIPPALAAAMLPRSEHSALALLDPDNCRQDYYGDRLRDHGVEVWTEV